MSTENPMNALVLTAMMEALGQQTRDELVKKALTVLITNKDDPQRYGQKITSPLEQAFNNAVETVAMQIVHDMVTNDESMRARIMAVAISSRLANSFSAFDGHGDQQEVLMIDPTLQDWLYAREVLRRLGFSPDDLYMSVHTNAKQAIIANHLVDLDGRPLLAIVIKAQGKEFTWTIGPTDIPAAEVDAAYQHACERWNAGDPDVSNDEAFFASEPFSQRVQLLQALHAKGFVCRRWN